MAGEQEAMPWRGATILAVLSISSLAGCLGTTGNDAVGPPPDAGGLLPVTLPTGFEFVCPPGESTQRSDGLCTATLQGLAQSLQEPYLAIHPSNSDILAIGVNEGETLLRPNPDDPMEPFGSVFLNVYVSEDGGTTWTRRVLPLPPGGTGSGDPALAFDVNGTLHVSGLVLGNGLDVFYTSSKDLGKTWSEPVLLSDDGQTDRNWITVGPEGDIYVPWQFFGETHNGSRIAWSVDAGRTWRTQEFGQHAQQCYMASVVVLAWGIPTFACSYRDEAGVGIYEFNTTSGAATRIAQLANVTGYWPQLTQLADGSVALCSEDYDGSPKIHLRRSIDGGSTWSEPVNVVEKITLGIEWSQAYNYWLTGDPWGALHIIIGGAEGTLPVSPPYVNALSDQVVVEVALDPVNWTVLSERRLSPTDPLEKTRLPPTLGDGFGDHYYGLAFDGTKGLLVWTRDRGLDLAALAPTLPGRAA